MLSIRVFTAYLIVCISFISSFACGEAAARHPNESAPLAERWKWGLQQRQQNNQDVWVAYSIVQQMHEREFIGSFYSDRKTFPTIYEVVTGKTHTATPRPSSHGDVQIIAKEELMKLEGKDTGPGKMVSKELAILFGYKGANLDRVDVSLVEVSFDFRGRNLIWLGTASSEESIALLQNFYEKESRAKFKEDFLMCIGVHHSSALVIPVLQRVLNSNASDDLRAKAAFWLGTQNDIRALKVLTKYLTSEKSEDVVEEGLVGMTEMTLPEANEQMKEWTGKGYSRKLREGAIFWLGQQEAPGTLPLLEKIAMEESDPEIVEKSIFSMSEMNKTAGVTTTLIRIAHKQPTREGRKHAIFWLSQNYTEKIESTLKDFVNTDSDREVQKHALFALAELEDGHGIGELIQIAKSHKDPELRKQAIFWLGECDDERAQKALLQIIEEN